MVSKVWGADFGEKGMGTWEKNSQGLKWKMKELDSFDRPPEIDRFPGRVTSGVPLKSVIIWVSVGPFIYRHDWLYRWWSRGASPQAGPSPVLSSRPFSSGPNLRYSMQPYSLPHSTSLEGQGLLLSSSSSLPLLLLFLLVFGQASWNFAPKATHPNIPSSLCAVEL